MDGMKEDKRTNYPDKDAEQLNKKNLAAAKKASKTVHKAAPNCFQYDQTNSELNKRGMSSPEAEKAFKASGLKLPKSQSQGHNSDKQ